MFSPKLEYIVLLLLFNLIGIALFYKRYRVIKKRPIICGLIIFLIYCTIIEITAIELGWWEFNFNKLIGITLLNVPIEEYLLFVSFYFGVIVVWEFLENELG